MSTVGSADVLRELFEGLFEPLLRKVVREELDARCHPSDDWRDQKRSPVLGPRRHCQAVRRRLQEDPHDPSAKIVGDRFLLTTDAIAQELDRIGKSRPGPLGAPVPAKPKAPDSPEAEALERVQRRLQRVK